MLLFLFLFLLEFIHINEVVMWFINKIVVFENYHSYYIIIISWVRAKVSFAILRSALLCLRGSRTPRRRNLDIKDSDLEIEKGQAGLH